MDRSAAFMCAMWSSALADEASAPAVPGAERCSVQPARIATVGRATAIREMRRDIGGSWQGWEVAARISVSCRPSASTGRGLV